MRETPYSFSYENSIVFVDTTRQRANISRSRDNIMLEVNLSKPTEAVVIVSYAKLLFDLTNNTGREVLK